MSAKEIVKISNLSVWYGEKEALADVNISFYADDFVGIIGPNGGGKSSLVKAIVGLVPHSGTIEIAKEVADGGIGYMPQQNLFDKEFPISVEDLVLSGLQHSRGLFSRYTRTDKEKVKATLEELGIAELAKRCVGELSGGQLQRALLGRAIISEPKLLILDEPANFVDNRFENELYTLLGELNRRMAIIMVSHDVGTIATVVKNVVCVNRTVHRHPTAELTPELLAGYHCPIQILSHGPVPHTVLAHHCEKIET